MSRTYSAGVVTAYGSAKQGGYAGTYEEFCTALGELADVLEKFEGFSVNVTTLAEGSSATASYSDGVLTLGIPRGDTGATGAKGEKGDKGDKGDTGATGNGIASIAKTGTSGLVNTYTITYTDGTTYSFNVTNGEVTEDSLAETLEDYTKYDDILRVVKITDATTTMSDMVTFLNTINSVGDHVVFDVAGLNAGMYLCTIYLGNGYYRIADMVTGFEGTGFFSSTDLLADIIKSGSQSTGKHYTVQWDKVNAQCTRLNDASAITTDTANFGHFGSVNANYSNPFDDIYPWSGRKLCNIDIDTYMGLTSADSIEDCVVAWEDDVNFDYNHQYGVWVYTPAFFGRSYEIGNYRYFDVTDENLQNNIAYKASIVGRWLGVDVTLTIDGASKHCNLPTVGMPMANIAVSTQHTYAKNFGASLNDIYTLDAVSLLYVVEYASLNIQNKIGNGVDNLYVQGLHPSADVSNSNTIILSGLTASQLTHFIPNAIVDIGATNGANGVARTYITAVSTSGSVTTVTLADAVTCTTAHFVSIHGLINVADSDIGSKSGYIGTNSKCNAYYRGQTFYANKFQYVLGAYRQTGTGAIWVADEDETDNYDALNTSAHRNTGLVLPTSNGYIKSLGMTDGFSFAPFCTEVGGSSSNPVGDYVYAPALTTGNTILLCGGPSDAGASCGFYGNWGAAASNSYWRFGSCPRLLTP